MCDVPLGRGSQKCDHLQDGGGIKKSWNSCDVIYGWPLSENEHDFILKPDSITK